MQPRDREVLNELIGAHDCKYPVEWCRPLDVGGSSNSDHSYRLSKLVKLGYAEKRSRGAWDGSRGSWTYRATEAGRAALIEYDKDHKHDF